MSFTELLRSSRSGRVTTLHKFLTNYDPNTKRVYVFVEGSADQVFYRIHIERLVPDVRDLYIYNCEGKKNVYEAYSAIVQRFPNCGRVLFFVDKDIDDIIGKQWVADPRIFTTEYYSIENYIVSREALKKYLSDFVKVRHVDVNLDNTLSHFEQQLSTFYKLVLPVMAWIVVMRRAGHRTILNDVKLDALFAVDDSGTKRRSQRRSLTYLGRVTQTTHRGAIWRQLRATCAELKRLPPKAYVRGKFEAWWFIECGRQIIDALDQVVQEARGSISIASPLNEGSFIQLLAAFTVTPPQLAAFLNFHLNRSAVPPTSEVRPPQGILRRIGMRLGVRGA